MYQIEICDGIDLYNRYLFVPVRVADTDKIVSEEVTELEPCFALNAIHVECFLECFLRKHFDKELSFNQKRIANWRSGNYSCKYEAQQGYNFYTYDTVQKMVIELNQVASFLETDFDNPLLESVKERYEVYYLHDPDSAPYLLENLGTVKDHIHVLTDFYRRIAEKLTCIMGHNPDALLDIEFGY